MYKYKMFLRVACCHATFSYFLETKKLKYVTCSKERVLSNQMAIFKEGETKYERPLYLI